MRKLQFLLLAVGAFAAAGCATTGTPQFVESRPPAVQRADAQRYDPFPENDTGPEVVGGRPREFDQPIAEPSRARWNPFTWNQRYGG